MNELKTLLVLSPGFPKDETDTTCLPERQMFLKALKRNNPSLKIIVLAFQYPYTSESYCWQGIEVISFNGRNKGKLHRLLLWFRVWQTLKKLKKGNNIIGVLNFWLGECALVGNFFSKKYKIKQYTWLLGQDARQGNKYFKLVNPAADNLIALSDFVAAEFYKNYHLKPQHIIPVGINTTLFAEKNFERTIDVMGAGSLITLKQYHVFINLIKSLIGFFPDINAVICGKGPEKQKLLRQIQALGLQNNIQLLDEVPHPEVLNLMQHSKVFLHPSSYEGFGSVCAEALYAGAHVVTFIQPMFINIPHWHIVKNNIEMLTCIKDMLLNNSIDHEPVLAYSADDTAKAVMLLFTK
jgi:glycosyltransferase involved in cell wall biosynthesis